MKRLLPFLLALAAIPLPAPAAGDARWVSMDAPEALDAPVLGLQRSAVALPGGFAVDTSLMADLGLLPNLGVRWAMAGGPHRVVVGARYALFVGADAYSAAIHALQPVVKRYDPGYSGPSAKTYAGGTTTPEHIQGAGLIPAIGKPTLWLIVSNTVTSVGLGDSLSSLQVNLNEIVLHAVVTKSLAGAGGGLETTGL